MTHLQALSVVMTAAAVLAGCGGSASTEPLPAASSSGPNAELRQAVEAYSAAYLGDRPAQAYAMLSARCRSQLTLAQMAALTHAAKALYGSATMTSYHEDAVTGESATVTYTYSVPTINQSGQRWTLEGGAWHWDGTC